MASAHASPAVMTAQAATTARLWSASDYQTLTSQFTAGISAKFSVKQFPWTFVTPESCFAAGMTNCYGANPDSPYGTAVFKGNINSTKLKKTDALVLIMQTPPELGYFGITSYLNTRYYSPLPSDPTKSGTVVLFESLNDSVNQLDIMTAGSSTPGGAPFSQLAVFVMTADSRTYSDVVNQLTALGYPTTGINLLALPITAVPLNMGTGSGADTYSLFMRAAYPKDKTAFSNYLASTPINTLKLSPLASRKSTPLPTPAYKVPGEGVAEPDYLKQARNQLVNELKAKYAAAYTITENNVPGTLQQTNNFYCADQGVVCNGDNPDAIYLQDAYQYTPAKLKDKILVVGVDHVKSGKATYTSDSVVNLANNTGVVAINNTTLSGSALKMAGITDPSDPRYALYSQLYAMTISYDCTGEPVCLTIPQPTADNPVGVPFGTNMKITARTYLDPVTKTRPLAQELILERAFTLRAN
ncbi:hypothetical protein KGA65_11255 [Ideonella sp. B7]|uniref:hypothetical protein n=1 Tax=Ideonella benzenivorans TaxID=2831643 RepID=UPI001CEC86B2|nr:hypothetical protein [Ideonella benzenivorans]MCA6217118.1 hypothetical protein [Ideonella benzenivorans]